MMRVTPRRLLSVAAILMLLTAILHTIGNLSANTDPEMAGIATSMRGFHFGFGMGMNPSMFDVHMALVLIMTVTFTALGFINLAIAAARDLPERLGRRIILINALWVAVFTALCWFYRIPPPLICGIVIEVPLIAALLVRSPGSA